MKEINVFTSFDLRLLMKNMSVHRKTETDVLCSAELNNLIDNKTINPITYKQLIKKVGFKNIIRPKIFEY